MVKKTSNFNKNLCAHVDDDFRVKQLTGKIYRNLLSAGEDDVKLYVSTQKKLNK